MESECFCISQHSIGLAATNFIRSSGVPCFKYIDDRHVRAITSSPTQLSRELARTCHSRPVLGVYLRFRTPSFHLNHTISASNSQALREAILENKPVSVKNLQKFSGKTTSFALFSTSCQALYQLGLQAISKASSLPTPNFELSEPLRQENPSLAFSRYLGRLFTVGGKTIPEAKSSLQRDLESFLSSLPIPKTLVSASPRDVARFLVWKDKGGRTKVHATSCPSFWLPPRSRVCSCPIRLAAGTVDSMIGKLRATFMEAAVGEANGHKPSGQEVAPTTFMVKRCKDLTICPVANLELYVELCDMMSINLRGGYLFRTLNSTGEVSASPFTGSAVANRLNAPLEQRKQAIVVKQCTAFVADAR
ncbi:hypothetical protein QZH41_017258 [Actinostola sp. cb2023]|nr:hypothetical protein QZH41_017258 [Actinostola sp. cb2023]